MKIALDHPPQLQPVTKGVVMQPADIAKKVMDIREQLALEWSKDLANIEARVLFFLLNPSCCLTIRGRACGVCFGRRRMYSWTEGVRVYDILHGVPPLTSYLTLECPLSRASGVISKLFRVTTSRRLSNIGRLTFDPEIMTVAAKSSMQLAAD